MDINGVGNSHHADKLYLNKINKNNKKVSSTNLNGQNLVSKSDTVEISSEANAIISIKSQPEVRVELVNKLKGLIDTNAYENAERVNGALTQFIEEEIPEI